MKIVEAYKCTSHEINKKTGRPYLVYAWKYEDGTGNGMNADFDVPFWIQGVSFEDDVTNFTDECFYVVESMPISDLPPCAAHDFVEHLNHEEE